MDLDASTRDVTVRSAKRGDPELGTAIARRHLVAAAVVALWMALGFAFHTDANSYLVLGVPITVAFQRWIAKRPLRALWVRDANRFALDGRGMTLAAALALTPLYGLWVLLRQGDANAVSIAWLVCATLGAVGAAFALRRFDRDALRALLWCTLTAGVAGILLMIAAAAARGGARWDALVAGKWLLLYFPATFVLEEVFFRGALDTYVYRPGRARGWVAALFVSMLWGVWHLPVTPTRGAQTVVSLLIVHTIVGVPLSIYWRRSGNLAVPAFAHALVDAVRNAVLP